MNIGLYGGAFDPPHNGHIAVIEAARKWGMDKLILIPCGNMPHKRGGAAAGAKDRIEMLRLATQELDYCEISPYEALRSGVSYSADTLEYFASLYPSDTRYFIVGADSFDYIDSWYEPQRIFRAAKVLVFPREGFERRDDADYVDMENVDISSSEVREKIKLRQDVSKLLPKRVLDYIIKENLYQL